MLRAGALHTLSARAAALFVVVALCGSWIPRHAACTHHASGHATTDSPVDADHGADPAGHCKGMTAAVEGAGFRADEGGCCSASGGLMALCCTEARVAPVTAARGLELPRPVASWTAAAPVPETPPDPVFGEGRAGPVPLAFPARPLYRDLSVLLL